MMGDFNANNPDADQYDLQNRGILLMRDRKPFGSLLWAVLLVVAATLGFNGCGDVNDVESPAPPPATLKITSGSPLPSGSIGIAYSTTLAASGGNPGYTWSRVASSPTLPNGLNLSPAGVISGTPTTIQTVTPKFRVVDTSTPTPQAVEKDLTIAINAVPQPSITAPPLLPNGIVGMAYSATLTAAGGTPPYTTWLVTPALPAGLILTPAGTTATISWYTNGPEQSHTHVLRHRFLFADASDRYKGLHADYHSGATAINNPDKLTASWHGNCSLSNNDAGRFGRHTTLYVVHYCRRSHSQRLAWN